MKIAVATIDEVSISQHFGRSKGFVVFDVDGTNIKGREFRTNNHTPHAQGLCNHGEQNQGHGHNHDGHSHAGILGLLGDCEVVLCGGMGAGAAQALMQNGIQPFVFAGACSAEEAVTRYLSGSAGQPGAAFCGCHH